MMKESVPAGEAHGPQTEAEETLSVAEDGGGEPAVELDGKPPAHDDEALEDAEVLEAEFSETLVDESGAAEADAGEADVIEQLREELADAQAQAGEYRDQMQRTAAEFQNARRRQEKQLSDAIDRANKTLILRLLPVLDDFDLAFHNAPPALTAEGADAGGGDVEEQRAEQAWVDGFRQIQKKLLDLLAEEGVTVIDASGEFDPMRHEAVMSEESDAVESGHIIDALRSGYEYKGQVLRPAMVRVAA